MIIMKKKIVTKIRQIIDLDADFFPTELRNDPMVWKKFQYENKGPTYAAQYAASPK